MKKHLFLFILTLAVLSVSNVWAGEQYILPVTSSTPYGGSSVENKLDNNTQVIYMADNNNSWADFNLNIPAAKTFLLYVGYSSNKSGNLRPFTNDIERGEYGFSTSTGWYDVKEINCGASGVLQAGNNKISICNSGDNFNLMYIRLEEQGAATWDVPVDMNIYWTTKDGEVITNSDFSYVKTSDGTPKADMVDNANTSGKVFMKDAITATSRKSVYFPTTGTYCFTFPIYVKDHATYSMPTITVNGNTSSATSVTTDTDNEFKDVTIELDVTAGTYPVVINYSKTDDKIGYRYVTITKKPVSCPGYTFHYGTSGQSDWVAPLCFTQVDATTEWQITDFVIPNKPNWYVGYQGVFKGSNDLGTAGASSSETNWPTTMYLAPAMDPSDESGTPKVGSSAAGAIGTIRIYSNSIWNNLYAAFIPDGYGITYGGSGHAFTETATANMWETDYLTLPDVSSTYYMGMETETEDEYVKYGKSRSPDEAISAMDVTIKEAGKKKILLVPGSFDAAGAQYAVYDVTNSAFDTDFMKDPDGDGVYEGYVGANCATIILCRMSNTATAEDLSGGDPWSKRWNQTDNIGINDLLKKYQITNMDTWNKCAYTTTEIHPATGDKGKFRMWANSKADNWFVHWIPYYTLSYDGNGGSGSTAPTVRNCESSTLTVSVASNGFTAPTGYEFAGWNTLAEGGGDSYAAGASYTLTANGTLYAQWSPLSYTVTLTTNGGTINADDVTSYTYGTGATLPTDVTKTGYDFGGWYDNSGLTGDRVYSIANNVTGNKAYWAKWTAKQTTITIDANTANNGSTTPGTVTATWGSELPSFTPACGASGYGLTGYFTNPTGGTKIINVDGSLVRNTDYGTDEETPVWKYEGGSITFYPQYDEMTTYAVTVNKNADYGTVTGASNYVEGATVNISATPYGGYEFDNWTTNDGVTFANANSASTSFTMIGSSVTVQANFRAETCYSGVSLECEDDSIAVGAVTGGTATPSQIQFNNEYYKGGWSGRGFMDMREQTGELYLKPVHIPAGTYQIDVWRINGNNRWLNLYSTNSTSHATISYKGTTYYKIAANGYSLQYNQNSTDDQNSGGEWDEIDKYTRVSVTLLEGDYIIGLYSQSWCSWDKVDITSTTTYSVTYSASGAQSGSTISAATAGGALSSGSSVSACTEVTFTVTPASGYVVEHWQVNDVTYPAADGLTDFTLAINRNVTVTYTTTEASTYSVTVNVNDNSYGSATGAGTYSSGDEVTLSATPESSYGFVNWTTEDGVTFADATAEQTTFTMPSKNVAVQANFAPLRTINYEVVGGNGTVACAAVSSGGTVVSGKTLTFTATPNAGYSVLGWYTYDGATETLQANTRAQNSFNYTISSNITIRVKFVPIMIALGDNNVGANEGEFQYRDGSDGTSSLTAETVTDPDSRFGHKVLKYTYNIKTTNCYRGITLPEDAGYSTSIATGATGIGFWYRTESTTDNVLMYFKVYTDSWKQKMVYLPATNQVWTYFYFENSDVTSATGFGFYINEQGDGKNTAVIGSNGHFWLSEVKPLTISDVTVNSNETKEIAQVVRDLTIYQGGQVTNEEDIVVAKNIYYVRPAKDNGENGKLGNNLDQWYTFAVPFTVSDVEVYDEKDKAWFDVNAVYYNNDATDQSSNNPDGAGHYYLQYLKDADAGNIGTFKNRWQYITPSHSLQIYASDYSENRYGYPKKDEAYIILFDSDQPIGNYFQTNTQIRFVGGPQTIDGTAKEWKVEAEGENYYMYANNTLHSFTLTGDAYLLNDAGTNFDLQSTPTIRPFECYIQATETMKAKYSSIPMRWTLEPETPTGTEGIQHSDSGVQKVMRNGQLYIIRNGQWYNADGSLVCTNKF